MPSYQWITYVQARQALAARLADPTNAFWSDAENGLYLIEALRTWSAFTEQWNTYFPFAASAAPVWYNMGSMAGSPRLRTLTDVYLYTLMEYHLLEPATVRRGLERLSSQSLTSQEPYSVGEMR